MGVRDATMGEGDGTMGEGDGTMGVGDGTMGVGEGPLFGIMVDTGSEPTVKVIPLAGIAGTCTVFEVQRTC